MNTRRKASGDFPAVKPYLSECYACKDRMAFDPGRFWLLFNLGPVTKLLSMASLRASDKKELNKVPCLILT